MFLFYKKNIFADFFTKTSSHFPQNALTNKKFVKVDKRKVLHFLQSIQLFHTHDHNLFQFPSQ